MIDFSDKYEVLYNIITSFLPNAFIMLLFTFVMTGILIRFIKYLR